MGGNERAQIVVAKRNPVPSQKAPEVGGCPERVPMVGMIPTMLCREMKWKEGSSRSISTRLINSSILAKVSEY